MILPLETLFPVESVLPILPEIIDHIIDIYFVNKINV